MIFRFAQSPFGVGQTLVDKEVSTVTHIETQKLRTPALTMGAGLQKQISPRTIVIVLAVVLILFSAPFWGTPWRWNPSFGGSYGDSVRGLLWIHEAPVKLLKVGDNVTYRWNSKPAMKRVWRVSEDGQWIWVGGDNAADGSSSGSCEIGWVSLPGATSQPPTYPKPNPETVPSTPIVAMGVVDGFWAPFDRRSQFEKQIRLFTPPEERLIVGSWIILTSEKRSDVYERNTGKFLWQISGKVTRVEGNVASFLKATIFRADPLPSTFNLSNGIESVPMPTQVAPPQPGEVDLRDATLIETSGQNPNKVFDGNAKTAWGIGAGCRQIETMTIRLPKPTMVSSIHVDGQYMFGTTLTVSASLRGKQLPVDNNFTVDRKVDTVVLTLTQKCRQPVTGQVKEVRILAS